jgi:hypothetical protein
MLKGPIWCLPHSNLTLKSKFKLKSSLKMYNWICWKKTLIMCLISTMPTRMRNCILNRWMRYLQPVQP